MSVVVRGTAELSDWSGETRVEFDYGEVTDDLFNLEELLVGSSIKVEDCSFYFYTLSSDAQFNQDATHFVAITMGSQKDVGKLVLMDNVLDGPFLLMLSQGERLKGFHCHNCAEKYVEWFTESQQYWKEKHHASRSPQDSHEKIVH